MNWRALDASEVLARARRALDVEAVRFIRYTTTGEEFIFGQSARPGGPWPRYSFERMVTCCDYERGAWSEEIVGSRVRAEMRGGGEPSIPRGVTYARDGYSWSQAGPKSFAAPWHAPNRLHQVWITPQGAISAAARNHAALQWRIGDGRSHAALSFSEPGLFSATVVLNEQFLVECVESAVPVAYCGMLPFVTTYSDYADFGGVRFPARIRRSQGCFPVLDASVTEVDLDGALDIEVPEAVSQAGTQRRTALPLAHRAWHIPGSHNCVAIEMHDHIVVVEAPLIEAAASAVFDAVKRAIPDKPIRYVICTHHHIDHAGGLRAAVAEGATIVTHALNKDLFERYFAAPRSLAQQDLSAAALQPRFATVTDKLELRDAANAIQLHHMRGNAHAEDLIMVYLPAEKLLIEADAFSPGAANAPVPGEADPFAENLLDNIERLGLAVDRIVPMHGPIVPLKELYRAVGRVDRRS